MIGVSPRFNLCYMLGRIGRTCEVGGFAVQVANLNSSRILSGFTGIAKRYRN